MRMWMVDPVIMCRQHLLGEHVEMHMFVGTLKKQKSVKGYLNNNLFEPLFLEQRHNNLAEELTRRGMKHNTPIEMPNMSYLGEDINWLINQQHAEWQLILRCSKCREGLRKLDPSAFNIKQYDEVMKKINDK